MQTPPPRPTETSRRRESKAEDMRITKRRVAKAERDERKDITMALTEVKQ